MPPDSAPGANQRGRSPLVGQRCAEFGECGEVHVQHPERHDGRDHSDRDRAETGRTQSGERQKRNPSRAGRLAERADRDDLQHQVAGARHDERDRGRDRDDAARVTELPGDVRADLPPGERPHEEADRGADTRPAVRQEGLEVLRLHRRSGQRHDRDHHGQQQRGEHELQPPGHAHAEHVDHEGQREEEHREHGNNRTIGTDDGCDVLAAQHRHDRRSGADAEQEPVSGHARRGRPERAARVAGDTARIGEPRGEGGERTGERDGKDDDRDHGDDARRTGDLRSDARQHQQSGAEHRADVQCDPLRQSEGSVRRDDRRRCGERASHRFSLAS